MEINKQEQLSLYHKYLGNFKPGRNILSPIRDEKTPSFCVFYKGDKYLWYDFGIQQGGDINSLMKRMGNTPLYALNKIDIIKSLPVENKYEYDIEETSFSHESLTYWNEYNIPLEILKIFNVGVVKTLYLKKEKKKIIIASSRYYNPIYIYKYLSSQNHCTGILNNYEDNLLHWKIYCPSGKPFKWKSNLHGLWIDGYNIIPDNISTLIITKSRKDVMVLHTLGYHAISFNSEVININVEFFKLLKNRFKNIYILYDNDETGIKNAKRLAEKFNIICKYIPHNMECKDISDVVKKHGKKTAIKIVNHLFYGINN